MLVDLILDDASGKYWREQFYAQCKRRRLRSTPPFQRIENALTRRLVYMLSEYMTSLKSEEAFEEVDLFQLAEKIEESATLPQPFDGENSRPNFKIRKMSGKYGIIGRHVAFSKQLRMRRRSIVDDAIDHDHRMSVRYQKTHDLGAEEDLPAIS